MIKRIRGKVVAVMLKGKRILLAREGKRTYFTLPGGGIDEGETAESALRREVKEETNCTIKNHRFLCAYLSRHRSPITHGAFIFFVDFKGNPKAGAEMVEAEFFTYNGAIKKGVSPSARFVLEECRKRKIL